MLPRKPPEAALDPVAFLDDLEKDIEAMRLAYDKYFLGIDRAAPVRQRERLDRKIRQLEGVHLRTTALRFRLGGLRARYVTYAHYWTRVLDQMERGVWRRELARPTPRDESANDDATPPVAAAPQVPAPPRVPPPPTVGPPRVAAPPSSDAAIDPQHARDVFDRLVAAKNAVGEPTEGLTFPAFLRKLSREAPKLQEQAGGKPLRFDVEVKAGKVRVRVRAS